MNPAGAATRMTASGTSSGSHRATSRLAEDRGSHAKAQPPSAGKGRRGSILLHRARHDAAAQSAIVLLIVFIAPKEFLRKAWATQAIELIGRRGRPPVRRNEHTEPHPTPRNDPRSTRMYPDGAGGQEVPKVRPCDAPSARHGRPHTDESQPLSLTVWAVSADAGNPPQSSSGPAPGDFHEPFWRASARAPDRA